MRVFRRTAVIGNLRGPDSANIKIDNGRTSKNNN